jgi:hypothetical protein
VRGDDQRMVCACLERDMYRGCMRKGWVAMEWFGRVGGGRVANRSVRARAVEAMICELDGESTLLIETGWVLGVERTCMRVAEGMHEVVEEMYEVEEEERVLARGNIDSKRLLLGILVDNLMLMMMRRTRRDHHRTTILSLMCRIDPPSTQGQSREEKAASMGESVRYIVAPVLCL